MTLSDKSEKKSDKFTGEAVMGSSPPRGVFTSSPQNCSPGDTVSDCHCWWEEVILGLMVMGIKLGRDDNVSHQFESAWC